MNRFIKRNILLVTFFAVALIGMLVMMGLTIWQYVDMRTATVKAEELGKTIDSLSAQTPAPSKENIRLIILESPQNLYFNSHPSLIIYHSYVKIKYYLNYCGKAWTFL